MASLGMEKGVGIGLRGEPLVGVIGSMIES